ncbi:virulence factor TspB C-terminal domain-related protein [Acinetobacter junii]|uniref:virulence factor TspB C-terminal domain-related protein n=1 Tax=Acinetobacter junii TaxID=40215 RepID=UPI00124F0EDB|nr:virulence factor TspB C-terminal domain-related protein [Acinetobacter junii]
MKRILVLLMCFNIVLAPTYVFATTNLGGWSIGDLVADGASSIVNGTKNVLINGVNVVKTSSAKITPTVGAVSKVLARGAAGYALSIAVEQILGAGVDWVLDPENNQIKYYPQGNFVYSTSYAGMNLAVQYSTLTQLCAAALAAAKTKWQGAQTYAIKNNQCYVYYGSESAYDYVPTFATQVQSDQKILPLDVVASQVISNAESETDEQKKAGAQTATTTAAQDMLANDAATQTNVQNQLETNARTQTQEEAQGETKPADPANPSSGNTIKLNFPVFCSWAPVVCEAAQVAISFPQTVTNWWTTATAAISASWTSFKEWLDWTKKDETLPETEQNSVTDLPTPELQENAISWGASCPADVQIPISLYGQSSTLTFSWSPWCQLLSIIKPAIIASAYIGAAFIVLGLRT